MLKNCSSMLNRDFLLQLSVWIVLIAFVFVSSGLITAFEYYSCVISGRKYPQGVLQWPTFTYLYGSTVSIWCTLPLKGPSLHDPDCPPVVVICGRLDRKSFWSWIRITELIKIWFSLGSSSPIYSVTGWTIPITWGLFIAIHQWHRIILCLRHKVCDGTI